MISSIIFKIPFFLSKNEVLDFSKHTDISPLRVEPGFFDTLKTYYDYIINHIDIFISNPNLLGLVMFQTVT